MADHGPGTGGGADGGDVQEAAARALLCDELPGVRKECALSGTEHELEQVVTAALAGEPIIARLEQMGVTEIRGGLWTTIPGLADDPSDAVNTRYVCPRASACSRVVPAVPGDVPRCELSGERMRRAGDNPR